MALPLDDLVTWLTANGIAGVGANWMPDSPDAQVIVEGNGGSPPSFDGTFETQHVLIRCRHTTDPEAEALALQVHQLLTTQQGSFTAGDTYVLLASSVGGPPRFLGRDQQQRSTYVSSYSFATPTA